MKFTSIKQIPKEAIEMIDDVQWYFRYSVTQGSWEGPANFLKSPERMDSVSLLEICNNIQEDGTCGNYFYIERCELEDKTYGINLYKKIHGEGK